MAKRMATRLTLSQAVAAIQESESDSDLSGNESSDDVDDTSFQPDPNVELSSVGSESDEHPPSDSEGSLTPQCCKRPRRQQSVPPVPDTIVSKNGHTWSTNPQSTGRTVQANILRQTSGVKTAVGQLENTAESFKLFVTEDMLLLAVRETNHHGHNATRVWNEAHVSSTTQAWVDTDVTELRAFLGLLLYVGVHKAAGESLPELWSATDGRPLFRAVMSLNRAKDLLRHLRFDNFTRRADHMRTDKLA